MHIITHSFMSPQQLKRLQHNDPVFMQRGQGIYAPVWQVKLRRVYTLFPARQVTLASQAQGEIGEYSVPNIQNIRRTIHSTPKVPFILLGAGAWF